MSIRDSENKTKIFGFTKLHKNISSEEMFFKELL